MNNKILLTGLVLVSLTGTTFAAGINNTVNPTAAYYGAEAYGNSNKIEETGRSAFAVGYNNTVSANNAFATGNSNKAIGINSIVGGEYSEAKGRNSLAIGSSARANVDNTFAIGSQARTNAENTIAIGNGAYANGVSSMALGRTNTVNGDDSVVVGANNGTVSAGQSAVFGYNNQVLDNSKEQLAFGSNNKTKSQGATVLGSHGQAVAVDSLALGNNTLADVQNSVALGTNSTTEEAVSTDHIHINGERYDFAGGVANSTVSIGTNNKAGNGGVKEYKRTLTNVAAGRIDGTSTDAVNGSQLNAVINALKFTTVAEGTNTTVKQTTNIDGGMEFSVNVNKDLHDMNSVNFGTNADTVHSVVNKEKAHFFNGDTNTAVTYNGLKLENTNNLDTASYTMNGMQASSNGKDIRFSTDGISAGNQIINSVKTGIADTDAVNVKQLKDYVATNDKDTITTVVAGNNVSVTNDNNHNYKVSVSKDFSDKVNNNTSRINDLDNKINDVGRNALERANHYTDLQVNKGVAKASALAGLKFLDYNPKDKWSFAASVGHYRNANAVAVGAAYQPNENTMVHGGITVDGKVAYNLGVSFKTGGQKYINKYNLQDQVKQLQSDNAELRQELNELRSMIEKNK